MGRENEDDEDAVEASVIDVDEDVVEEVQEVDEDETMEDGEFHPYELETLLNFVC